ncbi:MAG: thioredoxin domain-containing protein [Acidobacteria bacterium]|nr:thioredoxin domain-containing protein [Acidobacteriota bacterium]
MFERSGLMLILAALILTWTAPMQASENAPGHILGGALNAPVRIEVFSDFQCSACREFYLSTIRQVLQEFSSKDKVRVIYHEFPIQSHRLSFEAARYTEAAARLGTRTLLSVMDSLFMDQVQWSQDGKLEASISKRLPREDLLKLKKIMQDPGISQAIERELKYASGLTIRSTPTMIITYAGKQQRAEGLIPYLVLKQFLDSIIK